MGIIDRIRTVLTDTDVTIMRNPYKAHHFTISCHDCSTFVDHITDIVIKETRRNKEKPANESIILNPDNRT
jgi:hypothetical protein